MGKRIAQVRGQTLQERLLWFLRDRRVKLALIVILSFSSGCNEPSSQNDSPEKGRQSLEQQRQALTVKLNRLAQDAAKADLARSLPDWNPVGWSYQRSQMDQRQLDRAILLGDDSALQSQPVVVTVDLVQGQEHKVVSLVARQFTDESGNKYWRTEPLTRELRELILATEHPSESH